MFLTKSEIRQEVLQKRKKMQQDEVSAGSAEICKKVLSSQFFEKAGCVFVYLSFCNEVDTMAILQKAIAEKKKVCVPVVVSETEMIAVQIESLNDLRKNKFGILEPVQTKAVDKQCIDLALVPGVVFDETCQRTGFGKGFYDRFLEKSNFLKIGLAFECQVVQKLPSSSFDVPMDWVFTQKREIFNEGN